MNKFLRPVEAHDFMHIVPLPAYSEDKEIMFRMMSNILELPRQLSSTVLDVGGSPIAIFVALPLYPKVWELCAYVDKSVERCGLHYCKATKRLIDAAFIAYPVDRMQITVRADQPWAGRWATFLGFNFEGRLRKYGAEGVDHFLYAKVRE